MARARPSASRKACILGLVVVACVAPSGAAGLLSPDPALPADRFAAILTNPAQDPLSNALDATEALLATQEGLAPPALLGKQKANLAAAREMLGVLSTQEVPLARLVGIAAIAARLQASGDLDALAVSTPPRATLLDAVAELASRHGAEVDPETAATLRSVDPAMQQALARTVAAFLAFEDGARVARATGDSAPLLAARVALLETAGGLLDATSSTATVKCRTALVPGVLFLNVGPCAPTVCGAGGDVVLSIDESGNDTYCNNAGGASGGNSPCPPTMDAAALIDLAGNDQYLTGDCSRNGGAVGLASGFLLDVAGDDAYLGGSYGSNGGAYAGGHGFLADGGGDDEYTGFISGVNGGVHEGGVGTLIDAGGDDDYSAGGYGVNGGALYGSGLLVDATGSDTYDGYSLGINGGASGFPSTGFLLDGLGKDRYRGGGGGLNGGGGFGVGFLLDGSDDDLYVAGDGSGNGGAYGGLGLLLDGTGNDRYEAGNWSTNGGSGAPPLSSPTLTPYGLGMLVDGSGDDAYLALGGGTNGGAYGPGPDLGLSGAPTAVAALLDGGGRDSYTALGAFSPSATNGGAEGGGISLLLDAGGQGDEYVDHGYCGGPCGADQTVVTKTSGGSLGAQVDVPP